jgi:hypothetical protein
VSIRIIALLAALVPASFAAPASALIFREVPALDEIAAQAPLAFRGIVLDVRYGDAQLDDGTSTPYTLTRFEVLQPYRGAEAGETVTIARIGGPRHGDMRRYLLIPGLASFAPGEEVVVFADDVTHPFFGTLFGDFGALRVARVAGADERIVTSYHFRPVVTTAAGLGLAPDRVCRPVAGERNACSLATDHTESGDERAVAGAHAAPLTASAFDEAIAAIVAAHPQSRPAQTVSADPAAFAEALRQFAARRR